MTDRSVVLSPPRLIGTATVRRVFGVGEHRIYKMLAAEHPLLMAGYLGKFGEGQGMHIWNAHELFAGLWSTPEALWDEIRRVETGVTATVTCDVDGCDTPIRFLHLCQPHLLELLDAFRTAEKYPDAIWMVLALCRWVVDRNQHLTPPAGWDPWSGRCINTDCDQRTDGSGVPMPLCPRCYRGLRWMIRHQTNGT